MGSGFAKKKKEARALQEQFHAMQEKLKQERATGTAGAELVTVTLNGEHEMLHIKIKPECVDPEDIEGLEDLIRAAHNDALKKLEASSSQNLPPGFPNLSSLGF